MKTSLKDRLVKYFQKRHTEWVANGEMQRIVAKYTSYTPRTTCRRLEELVNEGKLEVQYRKGHAWYRCAQTPKNATRSVEELVRGNPARLAWFEALQANQ